MKTCLIIAGFLMLVTLPGCDSRPQSGRGFRLPDGNADKGKQAFLALKCNDCHKVEGVELPPPTKFNLTLGGETTRVKTYGELVTSIIDPTHVISEQYRRQLADVKESPMPNFNQVMTVEQMVDLVTFMQSHYKVVVPRSTQSYPYYAP